MRRRCLRSSVAIGAVAVSAVISACAASGSDEVIAAAGDLGHIHDLVVGDDGALLVASHSGLWRVVDIDRAVLVGAERNDLMAMTGLDGGALVASGHPDLRLEKYRVEDRPSFLGLARSDDGGRNWEVLGLLGEADFHALVAGDDWLFAAEASGRIWQQEGDGEWDRLGEVEARDLAVNPSDPSRQLAPDYEGNVWGTTDGAVTWSRLDDAPSLVEIEWPATASIVGVSADGALWVTASLEEPWQLLGSGPSDVETFHVDDDGRWWITIHGGAIAHSDDNGTTWTDTYLPPERP